MIIDRFGCIPFGGDYNPEQWTEADWKEDLRIMKVYGINTVTINVHHWNYYHPAEGVYDFTFLDRIVKMLTDEGINLIMGTGTTAVPNWMSDRYPDIMMTDIMGLKYENGRREVYCTNSPDYRKEIRESVEHLAEHFKDNKSIKLWHMSNEVGNVCYCKNCAKSYRSYLKKKYKTLDKLNHAWNTTFWGHDYDSWEQIKPPIAQTEYSPNLKGIQGWDVHFRSNEAIEYMRFFSESLRECYEIESAAIRKYIPDAIATNNFQFRVLDYRRACAASDVIAYDSYPNKDESPAKSAMYYDTCRGLHTPGKPFMVMEMTPSQASWEQTVPLKRPGEVELIALKGIAHGADSSLFFQIRRNRTGFEKYHGAMIDHCGHENTRTGRELIALSAKLRKLEPYLKDTFVKARVAVIMDFDNMYGVEIPCSIQKKTVYMEEVEYYYRYFNKKNIPVDILPVNTDLSAYDMVVAPMTYMVDASFGTEVERFVENGGTFVTTYYSGLVDMEDSMFGAYPGAFKKVCGIWVEETDALTESEQNQVLMSEDFGLKTYPCGYMCDLIHPEGARTLGRYQSDFYAGMSCITENTYGKGTAVYIGTKLTEEGTDALLDYCCQKAGVTGILETPDFVEACLREGKNGKLLFLMNNSSREQTVTLDAGWKPVFGPEAEDHTILLKPWDSVVYHS